MSFAVPNAQFNQQASALHFQGADVFLGDGDTAKPCQSSASEHVKASMTSELFELV